MKFRVSIQGMKSASNPILSVLIRFEKPKVLQVEQTRPSISCMFLADEMLGKSNDESSVHLQHECVRYCIIIKSSVADLLDNSTE